MTLTSEGTNVNELMMRAFQSGHELMVEDAVLQQKAAGLLAAFDASPDPANSAAAEARLIETRRSSIVREAYDLEDAVLQRMGDNPVELFLTERGKSRDEPPVFATLMMQSVLSQRRGEQVRADSLFKVRRFRGIVDDMNVLSGLISLRPLNFSRTSINQGYYLAQVLDSDATPLVRIEPVVRRGLERVTVFSRLGQVVHRALAH